VAALKAGRVPDLDQPVHEGPEIDLQLPALFPSDYIPDVHTRLVLYKRVAGCEDAQALRELQVELIDRFGLLPEPAKHLFGIAALKLDAAPRGIRKIEIGASEGRILFGDAPDIDTGRLINLVQTRPGQYRFEGGDKLRLYGEFTTEAARFGIVRKLLALLAGQDVDLNSDK
ncbi:MAG: transcription-repair coupling factor, partial [Gammaproteobacteria bacterium]|jgi:transcription-repair coupling factor (superfamily II helicase)